MSEARVYHGDSRELLKMLADNSIDAVVTDPPYALVSIGQRYGNPDAQPSGHEVYARATAGFMGRQWDTGETAFAVEFWAEVRRVLKPGGHVVAFSATRTYHRLACAIEDPGFEIRDMVAWMYGSGFPKSRDLAKAIDGSDTEGMRGERYLRFTEWMRSTGLSAERINALTGTVMASHYLSAGSQPAVPTQDLFERLRPHLPIVPEWVEAMVRERTVESENMKARPVVGQHSQPSHANEWSAKFSGGKTSGVGDITTALTPEAKAWEGWGTALKPALEPIVLARKPLVGTLARNLAAFEVGGLNIDGCRVPTGEDLNGGAYSPERRESESEWAALHSSTGREFSQPDGRWPANVVHDGSDEVVGAFPQSDIGGAPREGALTAGSVWAIGGERSSVPGGPTYGDAGSAARFFYSAKAGSEDRLGSGHPTVKPVDLMAWLVRLTCRKGGVVLDPFAGSGTTGLAAIREGCDAILIEREADHAEDIRRRLAWAKGEGKLTAQEMLAGKLAKDPAKAAGAGTPLFGGGDDPEIVGGGVGVGKPVRERRPTGHPERPESLGATSVRSDSEGER